MELYSQVDATQTETQNYYDMYNNLGQQQLAIEKEIKLLLSIQEGFEQSGRTQHSGHEFVTQLEVTNSSKTIITF